MILAALLAFTVGYRSNPFQTSPKPDLLKLQGQYQRMRDYYYNGNYEGASALAKEISRMAPHYADIDQQLRLNEEALSARTEKIKEGQMRPERSARWPASLRDSYYDAKIAFKKGHCEEVRDHLRPVERYDKKMDSEKMYEVCQKQKESSQDRE